MTCFSRQSNTEAPRPVASKGLPVDEKSADAALLPIEMAERLGTTPALRRLFAPAVARARRALAGERG